VLLFVVATFRKTLQQHRCGELVASLQAKLGVVVRFIQMRVRKIKHSGALERKALLASV
jgi:hypothetical protein